MHDLTFKLKFGVPVCRREAPESQSTGGVLSLPLFYAHTLYLCIQDLQRVFLTVSWISPTTISKRSILLYPWIYKKQNLSKMLTVCKCDIDILIVTYKAEHACILQKYYSAVNKTHCVGWPH